MANQDRTETTSFGIDYGTLNPQLIVVRELKKAPNPKFDYAHIKLGYQAPGAVRPWSLTQKLPDELRGTLRHKVDEKGQDKYTVTLMHDFDNPDDGLQHELHAKKLMEEWKRINELIAESLILMEVDPKFAFLKLTELKEIVEGKGQTWDKERILLFIEEKDIVVRNPVFQINVKDDSGVKKPIDNAERRLAIRMKVQAASSLPEKWQGMAAKYFHPLSETERKEGKKAERIPVEDMVDITHTGNYRMKVPYIYVAENGKYPEIAVQMFVASCFKTVAVESSSFEAVIEEEASQAVVSDDKYAQYREMFRRKKEENQQKASAEASTGAPPI